MLEEARSRPEKAQLKPVVRKVGSVDIRLMAKEERGKQCRHVAAHSKDLPKGKRVLAQLSMKKMQCKDLLATCAFGLELSEDIARLMSQEYVPFHKLKSRVNDLRGIRLQTPNTADE